MKKRGLGKGLSALLSDEVREDENQQVKNLAIIEIEPNPHQPRKNFDKELIDELSRSIEAHGVIQPIIVKDTGNSYNIIAGERRWRAARQAGLKEIPAIVKDFSKRASVEIALIENIQREDLNVIELAQAYNNLAQDFNLTQEDIGKKLGKSRSSIANTMRLLSLSQYVQEKILEEAISYGHAKALGGIKDELVQKQLVDRIIKENLTVRALEELIAKARTTKEEKKPKTPKLKDPFYKKIQDGLQSILGTRVNIKQGKKKGKIEIEYYSDEELERIISLIGKE